MSGTGNLRRMVRQTLTIARRDFTATVYTPTFLLFLLAPLIMVAFGTVGGLGARGMATTGEQKERIVAIVAPAQVAPIKEIDTRLRGLYRQAEDAPAPLTVETPRGDPEAQARALLAAKDAEVGAVLVGPLDAPRIFHAPRYGRTAKYLTQLADETVRAERTGGTAPVARATLIQIARGGAGVTASGKGMAAFFTVFGLFFLTLMLSGQAVGTMAEERSNKVIEVLAAAVPLESVFFGKLLGMFGSALLFLLFWGTIVTNVGALLPASIGQAFSEVGPAVGGPAFAILFFAYFVMAYMLLGAVFLAVGAQASSQREIQMLSLPITVFQMAMLGFSSAAASQPGTWLATAAEVFPFSSPFAMAAHAANTPGLWAHVAALAWQLLWVSIVITLGARWFRRGVLQSGGPKVRRKTAAR